MIGFNPEMVMILSGPIVSPNYRAGQNILLYMSRVHFNIEMKAELTEVYISPRLHLALYECKE